MKNLSIKISNNTINNRIIDLALRCCLRIISEYLDIIDFIKLIDTYPEITNYSYNNINYYVATYGINIIEHYLKYLKKMKFRIIDESKILQYIKTAHNNTIKSYCQLVIYQLDKK